MEKSLQLEIVTPDNLIVSEQVTYVRAPGLEGEFGVLVGHVPLLAALTVGLVSYEAKGERNCVFISGGFTEVTGTKMSILADSAEKACDIDLFRATAAKERAVRLMSERKDNLDSTRVELAFKRANNRIKATGTLS